MGRPTTLELDRPYKRKKSRSDSDSSLTIYINDPLLEVIKQRHSQRNLGCQYVFHRSGLQIKDFPFVWNKACRQAKLGYGCRTGHKYVEKWKKDFKQGPTIHDFRRTAVKNMDEAGASKKTIMATAGMKTPAIFFRYNIGSDKSQQRAAKKYAELKSGIL